MTEWKQYIVSGKLLDEMKTKGHKSELRKCLNCNKAFKAQSREINRGGGIFCGRSCAVSHRYKDKPKLIPISFTDYDHDKHRLITLTQGQYAAVNVEDYDRLSIYRWKAIWCKSRNEFRAARSSREGGKQRTYFMHREVLNVSDKSHVDHINHITLDNRRSNLRAVTNAENHKNTRMRSDNKSGVCGVSWSKQAKKWQSQIMSCGKYMHLGYFANLFEAVCVRKNAEAKLGFHINHGRKF